MEKTGSHSLLFFPPKNNCIVVISFWCVSLERFVFWKFYVKHHIKKKLSVKHFYCFAIFKKIMCFNCGFYINSHICFLLKVGLHVENVPKMVFPQPESTLSNKRKSSQGNSFQAKRARLNKITGKPQWFFCRGMEGLILAHF